MYTVIYMIYSYNTEKMVEKVLMYLWRKTWILLTRMRVLFKRYGDINLSGEGMPHKSRNV